MRTGRSGYAQHQRHVGPAKAALWDIIKYRADIAVFDVSFVRTFFDVEFLGYQVIVLYGGTNSRPYSCEGDALHSFLEVVMFQPFPSQDLMWYPAAGVVPLSFRAENSRVYRGGGSGVATAQECGKLAFGGFLCLFTVAQPRSQQGQTGGGDKMVLVAVRDVITVGGAIFLVP